MKTLEVLYKLHDSYLGKVKPNSAQETLRAYSDDYSGGVWHDKMPSGLATAEVTVKSLTEPYLTDVYAGYFGFTLEAKTRQVQPALAWYLGRKGQKKPAAEDNEDD